MDEFFVNEIISIKKILQSHFNDYAKDFNLKGSEIKLIHILSLTGEESQAELAKRMDCDKAHIHRIVIKLLFKKIICFDDIKKDNCRNIKIKLSKHGHEIADKVNKKMEEWKSKIIQGVNLEDLEATRRLFAQVVNNLNKEKNNA